MKTSRRSHLAALGASLAAFFGFSRKPASASPSCRADAAGELPARARAGAKGPNVVVSPDGRTRTYYNARGEVVETDRFDAQGRLVEHVRMGGKSDWRRITYTKG